MKQWGRRVQKPVAGSMSEMGMLRQLTKRLLVVHGLSGHWRMSAGGDNPPSRKSAEEALARLSPHRAHESNWFKALLCAGGGAPLVLSEPDRLGPTIPRHPVLPLVLCSRLAASMSAITIFRQQSKRMTTHGSVCARLPPKVLDSEPPGSAFRRIDSTGCAAMPRATQVHQFKPSEHLLLFQVL